MTTPPTTNKPRMGKIPLAIIRSDGQTYDSAESAGKANLCHPSAIRRACRFGTIYHGQTYKYQTPAIPTPPNPAGVIPNPKIGQNFGPTRTPLHTPAERKVMDPRNGTGIISSPEPTDPFALLEQVLNLPQDKWKQLRGIVDRVWAIDSPVAGTPASFRPHGVPNGTASV